MKKTVAVFGVLIFLFPSVSSASTITYQQASSIIVLLEAFGVNSSTIATVKAILEPAAPVAVTPVVNPPIAISTPSNSCNGIQYPTCDPSHTFTCSSSGSGYCAANVQQSHPILGSTQPPSTPVVQQPSLIPVQPTPVSTTPVSQGVTTQVGYSLQDAQQVVSGSLAAATEECTSGNTSPDCPYLYGSITDFQNEANLIQSQLSTNRSAYCDNKLAAIYVDMGGAIGGYYTNMMNLVNGSHTTAYAQGMAAQYLSAYQARMAADFPQAQSISSTCFQQEDPNLYD